MKKLFLLPTPEGEVAVSAYLLGEGSSARPDAHTHEGEFAPPGQRCSSCRWQEVLILDEANAKSEVPKYVIHTLGQSVVPGEFKKCRLSRTSSAFEIVEILTVRTRDGSIFLPAPASRALAQAADLDENIRDAYINRKVAA